MPYVRVCDQEINWFGNCPSGWYSIQISDPSTGGGVPGEVPSVALTQEDFATLWVPTLLLFATAFGIRAIRKFLYPSF